VSVLRGAAGPPLRVVGVRRLADYLKRKIESDPQLRNVSVRGELSNASTPRGGHFFFDLKEDDVVLRCFAFASDALDFPALRNGIGVVATGTVTTYGPKSTYQLIVRGIELDGIGNVHALFEERKKKLAADGLFEPARKRPLPLFPFRVALVSSRAANGAVDFVTLLRERAPHVTIVWFETSVQGPNAPLEIVAALGRASRADVDLIVLTRGGGSFEDLFAFSDEGVVRAVARAAHPVVSAIGHTVDQQLCDFAADVHVETPSKAAEATGFGTRELQARLVDGGLRARRAAELRLERMRARLTTALVRSKLVDARLFLAPLAQRVASASGSLGVASAAVLRSREERSRDLARRLEARDPSRRLAERGGRLAAASLQIRSAVAARLERAARRGAEASARLDAAGPAALVRASQKLALARAHLDGKNPEAILQRGYAIVTYNGAVVRDARGVAAGEVVQARLARGTLEARVERNETDGNERIE